MSLQATIRELRRVPRAARVAQGFSRLRDFARHVLRVRAQRAELREKVEALTGRYGSIRTVRREIERRLQKLVDADQRLRQMARQAAGLDVRDYPPVFVTCARVETGVAGRHYIKYHWSNAGARGTVYHKSTRRVVWPVTHLLRAMNWTGAVTTVSEVEAFHLKRLQAEAAERSSRSAARRQRIAARFISQPHAIERAAAGLIDVPRGLPEELKKRIAKREREIASLRAHRRHASLNAADATLLGPYQGGFEPYYLLEQRTIVRHHGIQIQAVWHRCYDEDGRYWLADLWYRVIGESIKYQNKRDAVCAHLDRLRLYRSKTVYVHGKPAYTLRRRRGCWSVHLARDYDRLLGYVKREQDVDAVIRAHRHKLAKERLVERAAKPSKTAPDTLGWRAWRWDGRVLRSPHQHTTWETRELRADAWDDAAALRGKAGIHARRVPRDWLRAGWPDDGPNEGRLPHHDSAVVTGIVERFGRYVLGTTGWRAEIVIIRELCAPDVPTMLALKAAYPDVRVHLRVAAEPTTIEET